MKKVFFIVTFFVFYITLSCSQTSQQGNSKNDGPVIEFEETVHDFGTITQGSDNGMFGFVFKNTGKEPLILSNVRSSCGCTVPVWPKEPIKKGEKDTILVKYNTKILGSFTKNITVYYNNGETPITLTIKGKVEAADQPKQ
jgi:hypothetical protein